LARHGLTRPYLLFAGSPRPNKNLSRMLGAFAQSALAASHDVVVLGRVSDDSDGIALRAQVQALGLQARVCITGYVSDADLALAFSAASGLLFASLDEGYGLPILEGMASGIAVLTSTATSCPEVAGGHAVLVDPLSVSSVCQGINQLPLKTPAQLEAARAYASAMTWRRSAVQTLDILRDVVAKD
jgi:glycosyltransferase involved in cell wall biosynthesis